MTCLSDYPLEPPASARCFDPDHGRFAYRPVILAYLFNVVSQLQRTCLTRPLITPTKRLLVWMKVNSNVKCHGGFSCCQRADPSSKRYYSDRQKKPSL